MAQDDKPYHNVLADLDEVNMDLESSSSLGIDATDILLSSKSAEKSKTKSPQNDAINAHQYPSIRKPPPPPQIVYKPINPSIQSSSNKNKNKNKNNESKESPSVSNTYQSSLTNLFTSAKNSISRGAKSVSTKTSERISLDGQLRQARISLERFVNPKIINTEISADKTIPKWILKGCKGIVFLTVVKCGFLLAGSIGTGCVIVRKQNGQWSGPSSIGVAGIAAGFLVGASKIDYIMILPNDNAVQQFTYKGQLRLGGELQLAVGPLGRDASGSVGRGDKGFSVVYSYSHAAGLYGGLGLDGKIISVRPKCNEEFYGEKISVNDILLGKLDPRNIQNNDYELITHLLDAYCIDDIDDEKKVQESTYGAMNLTAVFGRDISELECSQLKEYKSAIPNVLIALKDALYKYEYHLIEGIFRIDCQKSKVKIIKDEINNGNLYDIDFEEINGIIIGGLIKMWFRELPNKIFTGLDYNKIEKVETVSDAQILIHMMNEPELSYFYWLLDLCIEIGKYSDLNSMSVNNMAVVMTPNLYDMNNMKNVTINTSMIQFVSLCIELRIDMKHLNNANKIMDEPELGMYDEQINEEIETQTKPDIPL